MTDAELIAAIEGLRDTMVNVATGGHRIPTVNDEFRATYGAVAADLAKRRIENPLTHGDLWDCEGDSYRVELISLFKPIAWVAT